MKKLLVSHIYNEEYLLKYWLNHHKKYFDHGIIVDYHSTDNSVNIIKNLCPTWEVVPSRFKTMSAGDMDDEIRDIESKYRGWWKATLSTTEFLVGDYNKLNTLSEKTELLIPQLVMVEEKNSVGIHADENSELFEQKTNGIHYDDKIILYSEIMSEFETDYIRRFVASTPTGFKMRRTRKIHNYDDYIYSLGRHYEDYSKINTEDFIIVYYRYCPWNNIMLNRMVKLQDNLRDVDRSRGWGIEHFLTEKDAKTWYELYEKNSRDLSKYIKPFIDKLPK